MAIVLVCFSLLIDFNLICSYDVKILINSYDNTRFLNISLENKLKHKREKKPSLFYLIDITSARNILNVILVKNSNLNLHLQLL